MVPLDGVAPAMPTAPSSCTSTSPTRKLAELALSASQRQFEKAFVHAAVGVALIEIDGQLPGREPLPVQPARLLGSRAAGKNTFLTVTHVDDLQGQPRDVPVAARVGRVRTIHHELRYVHREGITIWAHLSLSLLRSETGEPAHFIAQFQDLTEQRRASEEVRIQAAMLDQIGQAVIATDITGRITYANRRAAELYGWPRGRAARPGHPGRHGPADHPPARLRRSSQPCGRASAGKESSWSRIAPGACSRPTSLTPR